MFRKKEKTEGSEPLAVSMTRFSHIMESFSEVVMRHKDQLSFSHRLYEGNSDEVIEDVVSGRVNVGVFHFDSRKRKEMEELLESKGLKYHFLSNVEPHIIISRNHPLLEQRKPVLAAGSRDTEKMRAKITYLTSRATLMYMIAISDCYSIGIHDFARQEAAYHSTSIPIQNCGFMLEFGYATVADAPVSEITAEFIRDLKKRLS